VRFSKTQILWQHLIILSALLLVVSPGPVSAHSRVHPDRSTKSRETVALLSRSAMSSDIRVPQTVVVGQLGSVIADNAPIYADRAQYGRVLSRCPIGANLTITGETNTYYAVMMVDRSTGFIAKTNVQLMQYEITAPSTQLGQPAGQLGQALVQSAVGYLGVPYVWGGNTMDGIDCSGFVKAVYQANGMTLPRTAAEQAQYGYDVPLADSSQWQVGDRMYFMCHHSYIDHTGMYIGGGYFIHSSISNHGVNVTSIDAAYYRSHLVAMRRSPQLVGDAPTGSPASTDTESNQQ